MNQAPLIPDIAVIVLAAGKGTRMKSELPKVLHPMAGMPMLGHVLTAARTLNPTQTVVITGYGAEQVEAYCTENFPETTFARQAEQLGTGHAIMQAEQALKTFTGTVIIVYADIMLGTRPDVLPTLMEQHRSNAQGLTLLTANVPNPKGFGRVFMQKGILINVEEKDCTPEQKKITTVNPCIYAVNGPLLFKLLAQVSNNNAQNEYYLTDIIALAHTNGAPVIMAEVPAERPEIGMNSRAEVAEMETLWQTRKRQEMMANGVTLVDPSTVYFSADTTIKPDVTIHPNVVFGPGVTIHSGATVFPFCHIANATLHKGVEIGPFARLRQGVTLNENVHIGTFVESKNSTFGQGSKAMHLSYIGDATVGAEAGFGGGTITANYNQKTKVKSRTVLENGAMTGANSTLVAPVKLGKNARTGAGTVVRNDIEEGALLVSKPEQITKPGYNK